jgi:hypothetical protein
MRTIKIITFAAFLFIALPLTAQDTTKPFYFPHTTGDMWEYIYSEFGTPYTATVQNLVISDSTDSQGIIHITQYARSINPLGGPYLFLDTNYYTMDTSFNVYGPYFFNYQHLLVYKLDANQGDQWIMHIYQDSSNIYGYEMARVEVKEKVTILDTETNLMRIKYFGAYDSSDTNGIDRYIDEIADGLGLIYRVSSEYFGEIHLVGAIINDTLYGKVTSASAKEKENSLPLSIKLNQNYPNPFNPSTTISFELSKLSNISLIIYDVLGKEIYRLIDDKEFNTGEHQVVWNGLKENGGKAASGIYFYRLITDKQTLSHSMILLK